jgi:hypothetical protein
MQIHLRRVLYYCRRLFNQKPELVPFVDFMRHRYKSAGVRSDDREGQETVRSTTSIDLCSENLKPTLPRGEGGQEPRHQQTIQFVVLSNSI